MFIGYEEKNHAPCYCCRSDNVSPSCPKAMSGLSACFQIKIHIYKLKYLSFYSNYEFVPNTSSPTPKKSFSLLL